MLGAVGRAWILCSPCSENKFLGAQVPEVEMLTPKRGHPLAVMQRQDLAREGGCEDCCFSVPQLGIYLWLVQVPEMRAGRGSYRGQVICMLIWIIQMTIQMFLCKGMVGSV